MNNMQYIVKDSSRYAMHVAVELCELGDFDSVTDAFRWLMQERDDFELRSGTLTAEQVEDIVYRHTEFYEGGDVDVQAITDELNAALESR